MRSLVIPLLLSLSLTLHAAPAELDWLELLPPEDLAALEAMPEIEHNTPEAAGFSSEGGFLKQAPGLPEVMYSTRTVAELDGREVRLAGYPVPLESDEQGRFIEFFLVPYPGACIHVPPPPSNQIVHAVSPLGVPIQELWQPFWIEGAMKVGEISSELAEAGYHIRAEKILPYEEGDL